MIKRKSKVVSLIFEIYFEVNFNKINWMKFDADSLIDSYLFFSNFASKVHLSE